LSAQYLSIHLFFISINHSENELGGTKYLFSYPVHPLLIINDDDDIIISGGRFINRNIVAVA